MEVDKGSASTINHPQEEDWFDFNSAPGASVERNPEVVVNDDSWAGFEGASGNATEPLISTEVGNELNSATVDDFGIDDWADFKVAELPSTELVSALNTFSPNSVEPIMRHFEDPVVSGDVSNSAEVSESVAAEEIFETFVQNRVDTISIEDNLLHRAELNKNTTHFDEIDVWAGLERTEPINQSSTVLLAESNIPINESAPREANTEQDRNDISVLSLPVKGSLPEIELNDNLTATISKNSDACDFIDIPDSTSNIQMEQISLQPGNDFLNEPLGSFSTEVNEVANGTDPEALPTKLIEGFAPENVASDVNVAYPTFAATENECLALNPVVDIIVFSDPTSENEPASEASSAEVHEDLKTVVEFPSDTSKNEIRDDTVAMVPTELIEELPGISVGDIVTKVAITPVDSTEAVESTTTTTIEVSILEKPALTSEMILVNQVEADNLIEDNFAAVNDVECIEAAPTFLEILPDALVDSEIARELVEGKAAIMKPQDVHEFSGIEAEIATSVVEPISLAPVLTGLGEEQIVENKDFHDAVEPVAGETNIIELGESPVVEHKDSDDIWTGLETTPASAAAAIAEPAVSEITTTHLGDEKTNERVEESNDDVWAGSDIASNSAATDGTSATAIVETVVAETNTIELGESHIVENKVSNDFVELVAEETNAIELGKSHIVENNDSDNAVEPVAEGTNIIELGESPVVEHKDFHDVVEPVAEDINAIELGEVPIVENNDSDDIWTGLETTPASAAAAFAEPAVSEITTTHLGDEKTNERVEESNDDVWAGSDIASNSAATDGIVENTDSHDERITVVEPVAGETNIIELGESQVVEHKDSDDIWTGLETTPASAAAAIAEPAGKTNERVEESNDDVWAGLDIASNSAATDGTSATTIVETVVAETNTMEPLESKVDATEEDHNNNDDEWAGFEATPSSTAALLDEPMSSVSTTKLTEGNTDTKEEGNDDNDDDWTGFETASVFTSTVIVESVASETTSIELAQSKNIEFGEENDDDDWAGFEAAPASANIVNNTIAHQTDVFESKSSNVPPGLGAMAENNSDDDNDDWTGFEGGASSDADIPTAAPSTMSGTVPMIAPTQPQDAATVPPATLAVLIRDKDALTSGEQSLFSLLEKLSAAEKTVSSSLEANADTSNDTKLLSTVSHWQHFSSLLFPSCPVALSSSVSESSTAADEMPVISVPARLRCDTGLSVVMNNAASNETEVQSGVLLCRSSLQQLQEQRGLISANGDVLDMKALDAQLERLHLLPHQLRNQSATPVSSSAASSSAVTANAATGLTSYISDTNLVRCGSGWQRKIARLSAKSMSMSISHDAHDSDLALLSNQVSLVSLSQTDLQPPKPSLNSATQLHAGDGPSASHSKGSTEEQRNHGSNLWTSGTGESDDNNNNDDDDWGGFVDSSPATPALTVSSGSHSVSAPSASAPKASTTTSHVVGMGIADPFASSGTAAASSPMPPPTATTAKASATATVPAEDAAGLSNAARAVLLKLPDLSYILAST